MVSRYNRLFIFFATVFVGLYFDKFNIFRYCIISSFLHECGHIIAYRIIMNKWPEIQISVCGMKMKNNVAYNKNNVFVVICGPLINLILTIFSVIMINFSPSFDRYIFAVVNVFIFIFNILPIYYLDGGQILYCFSWFYQRNYLFLSNLSIIAISVMVFCFTDELLFLVIPLIYYIFNTLNHI